MENNNIPQQPPVQPEQPPVQPPVQPPMQPPVQPPYQPAPVVPNNGKTFAILSLIFGIAGTVFCWSGYGSFVFLALSVLAIVFGAMAQKRLPVGDSNRTMATVGLVFGIIGTVLCTIFALACVICVCAASSASTVSGAQEFADAFSNALASYN